MTIHKCACGRYIKALGWASHRRTCPDYQAGLRRFMENLERNAATPAPTPPAGVGAPSAEAQQGGNRDA